MAFLTGGGLGTTYLAVEAAGHWAGIIGGLQEMILVGHSFECSV